MFSIIVLGYKAQKNLVSLNVLKRINPFRILSKNNLICKLRRFAGMQIGSSTIMGAVTFVQTSFEQMSSTQMSFVWITTLGWVGRLT